MISASALILGASLLVATLVTVVNDDDEHGWDRVATWLSVVFFGVVGLGSFVLSVVAIAYLVGAYETSLEWVYWVTLWAR